MKHTVCIPPHEFTRIKDGSKTFIRTSDETGFQYGDELEILEFDEEKIAPTDKAPKGLTGNSLHCKLGFVESSGSTATLSLVQFRKPSKKK